MPGVRSNGTHTWPGVAQLTDLPAPPPPLQATHAAVYPVLEARLAARASGLSSRIKAAEVFKGKSCTVLLKAGGGW